jgi:pimeloyl-ACP methyl ester carboxylesterase
MLRHSIAAIVVASMSIATCHAGSTAKPDSSLDLYAKPGESIAIGSGRHLNLRCSGAGSPTVVLESGAMADSLAWFKVQPQVARFARVCSYDRAGYGFSDGSESTHYLDGSIDDLHALIGSAKITTPIVFVGHSLGTNIVRSYAGKYPADVAAMVLLDPPEQDVARFSPAWAKAEDEGRIASLPMIRACAQAASAGKLESPAPELANCLRGPNPEFSAALNAAQRASKLRPAFWHSVVAVQEGNGELYSAPVSAQEHHGTIPLLILAPDGSHADAKPDDRKALDAASAATHKAIAATSKRSEIVPVAHSSHDIQFDRPDAVVDAIRKAIKLAAMPKPASS